LFYKRVEEERRENSPARGATHNQGQAYNKGEGRYNDNFFVLIFQSQEL